MAESVSVQTQSGWEVTVLQRRLYKIQIYGVDAYREKFPRITLPDDAVAVVLSVDETGEREPQLRFITPDCIHEINAAVRMSSA